MQLLDDKLILSASDLNNYLACLHLITLDLARVRGSLDAEQTRDAAAGLLAEKGEAHEEAYLQTLLEEGRDVVQIANAKGSHEVLLERVAQTEEAMRAGAEVIYQATFFRDGLRGHADFLYRVDRASELGDYSYEVADAKLARRAKPYFILQLCFYSDLLRSVQGVEPERMHVILGTSETRSFRLAEFFAYFQRVRDSFFERLSDGTLDTYPEPVAHCELCGWRELCDERRVADDHLSLVANISRTQRDALRAAGIDTLEALGSVEPRDVSGIGSSVLSRLHDQARLQLQHRRTNEHSVELRPPEEGKGFARLPHPSEGDVFFDMEGDPFFDEGGLEYLFGYVIEDGGEPDFTVIWGRDRAEEKLALEHFIDFVIERRRRFADLHVYHYNHYEVTALKRLAGAHATREEELDVLLREEVFVDLFKVVRESMLISQPSYSIKKVEAFYMEARDTDVTDGGDSVVMFEQWLNGKDERILQAIAEYNRDDCISTLKLRDWLLERREQAVNEFAGSELVDHIRWFEPEPQKRSEEALALREENEELMARLLDGVQEDRGDRGRGEQGRWLLAQLLEYHHREGRPVWWAFFDRLEAESEQLKEDAEALAMLTPDASVPPRKEKKSMVYRFDFPAQETKLGEGSKVHDPATGQTGGEIIAMDQEAGWLDLKRGPSLDDVPLPTALIPGGPYNTKEHQGALRRLAGAVLDESQGGSYRAASQILNREVPVLMGREPGTEIDHPDMEVDELKEVVASLDEDHLVIQGPPGTGKTTKGAELIVDLIRRGQRVGVTSGSHKVIHNLLRKVEEVAGEQGGAFRGLKKCSDDNPESEFDSEAGLIKSTSSNDDLNDHDVALTAGTAWHYCREDVERLDYLFIDEAGQISLADALALATAARNVVLLGDPQQLPQVSQAAHPDGSSLSVLEHLLGDDQTVRPERGIFLDRTYRLHPELSEFISELMYDGRLRSAAGCDRQRVDAPGELTGTGLRWLAVEHEGRSQSAPEEADAIAAAVAELLAGGTYTDSAGDPHPLGPEDILVLSPYNAQVRCLQERVPAGVRVGTVDKFQGQESQVAFFSMATSSGEEIPRNVAFLLSRNRLNVALSRARSLAVLACSPRLLDVQAKSIEDMRLVNALCRFGDVAERRSHL